MPDFGIGEIIAAVVDAVASAGTAAEAGAAVTDTVASGLTAAGIGSETATAIAGQVIPALSGAATGAGIGAGGSALTGGDPLKGAEFGGLTGGAIGGAGGAIGDATGLGATGGDVLAGLGAGALGGQLTGTGAATGALTGGASGLVSGLMSSGSTPTTGGSGTIQGAPTSGAAASPAPGADILNTSPTAIQDIGGLNAAAQPSSYAVPAPSSMFSSAGSIADSIPTSVGGQVPGSIDYTGANGLPNSTFMTSTGSLPLEGATDTTSSEASPSAFTNPSQVMAATSPGTTPAFGSSAGDIASSITPTTTGTSPSSSNGNILSRLFGGSSSPDAGSAATSSPGLGSTAAPAAGGTAAAPSLSTRIGNWAGSQLGYDPDSTVSQVLGKGVGVLPAAAPLAYEAIAGTQSPKGTNQLSSEALAAETAGTKLESYLGTGTLPPGMQQALNTAAQQAITSIKSKYASMGQSGSSAEAQEIAQINANMAGQGAELALQLYQQGVSQSQGAAQIQESLLNNTIQQDAQFSNALGTFAAALAGGGGTNIKEIKLVA